MSVLKIILVIVVIVILIFIYMLCLAMCSISKVANKQLQDMEGYRKERERTNDKMSM